MGRPRLVNPDQAVWLEIGGAARLARVSNSRAAGEPGMRARWRGSWGRSESLGHGRDGRRADGSWSVAAACARASDLLLSYVRRDLSTDHHRRGVSLNIEGEEHLWSQRPAVFIFNHQSGLDSLLMAQITQRDVVGVAKKELENAPIVGPLMKAAGVVFVDRGNRSKAIEAMQPAVDAMRKGLSVVIAPEGTRSATKKLGKFKKGAFRMAMAAGVPIVPVVLRNALDALPRDGIVIRSATVDVVVHPPISTLDWNSENLDEHIKEIESLYRETLAS